MSHDRLQSRADELATRVQALAAALHASGISDETCERLLSQASAAALQALALELLLEPPDTPAAGRHRPASRLDPGFRLAA